MTEVGVTHGEEKARAWFREHKGRFLVCKGGKCYAPTVMGTVEICTVGSLKKAIELGEMVRVRNHIFLARDLK
jgi:hypothetical protein